MKNIEDCKNLNGKKILLRLDLNVPIINKKIQDLQKELNDYRVQKDEFNKSINQKKLKATSEMVVYLNKILGKYASENSISLVIQKKNIVIGKSEMDITKPILEIFNKEIKDVKVN